MSHDILSDSGLNRQCYQAVNSSLSTRRLQDWKAKLATVRMNPFTTFLLEVDPTSSLGLKSLAYIALKQEAERL
jgi:hypothetical protein